MKIILLILALSAVALAAPADDDDKKIGRTRDKGDSNYDANLKFNWKGDGDWKSNLEAMFKPVADLLNALGFNGALKSESNGKGGGDISGDFTWTGGRNGKGNARSTSGGSEHSGSSSGPGNLGESIQNALSSLIPQSTGSSGSRSGGGIPQLNIPGLSSGGQSGGLNSIQSGGRSGRNALPSGH